MKSKLVAFFGILFCLYSTVLIIPTETAFAQSPQERAEAAAEAETKFLPLVGIPGVTNAGNEGFGDYINALYRLSISIAALLAVIKIVAAGAKYMLSDIVTSKESAKADIRGALIGLLIIIGAVVILTTINSDITKNEFVIDSLEGVDPSDSQFARLESRLSAATAACDANPNCSIATGQSETWCNARQGQFVPGRWLAFGDATVSDRCFYDPANIPNGTSELPPNNEGLDPTDPGDLNTLNAECRGANGPDWYYENGGCVQSPVVTQEIPASIRLLGDAYLNNPENVGAISGECVGAYGSGYYYNPSLRLCASRE